MPSNKQTAGFFTREEDKAILDFITKDNRILFCGGNQIWKKAEKEGVCPGRTFWSIKERFRKTILKNLQRYNLDEETKKKISGFAKASAPGKARLRFELAKPEDYEYLLSGNLKDKSNDERSSEEEEDEELPEEQQKDAVPEKPKDTTSKKQKDTTVEKQKGASTEKRKDTVPEKQKDMLIEKQSNAKSKNQKNMLTENLKSPKKIVNEPAAKIQGSPKKRLMSQEMKALNDPQHNSIKRLSALNLDTEDPPEGIRRSQRNSTKSPNQSPNVPDIAASPKKTLTVETKKQQKSEVVKEPLSGEKKKKALISRKKQLKAILKNL